jgi:mRNA-degrading endonuclease RelE of RelBE toxin-antitoxin system
VTAGAQKQIAKAPLRIQARLWEDLKRLEDWPDVSGAKPLSGKLAGNYRIRTGDYRLQFRVEVATVASVPEAEETKEYAVFVVKVGHRDRFYDD